MQSKKIFTYILILTCAFLASCKDDLLKPDDDNHSDEERLFRDPAFAEGILLNAYVSLPNSYTFEEAATDDAVSNLDGNAYRRIATGEWSSRYNPLSVWGNAAYQPIYYINYFLSINDRVDYAWDDRGSSSAVREAEFRKRFKGEAVALRAWYNFDLLKRHGGVGADGTPLGFVIMKEHLAQDADVNIPRSSYAECIQFIMADIDTAIKLLPDEYVAQSDVAKNAVYGVLNKNRVNGRFAKALKSRVALYTASMPFITNATKWEAAAAAAAVLLKQKNGVAGLSATGMLNFWWGVNDAEILFRRDFANSNTREQQNFPPSRFGRGEINPSQNLVEAFPMANGYPITVTPQSNYNANNPYAGRDPRLAAYIVFNGGNINNVVVRTNVEEPQNGLNKTVASTRTGYYLKKLLQPAVNLTPTVNSTARHYYTLFRYTEMYLNYAEAANEAWGPTADPQGNGFTAFQIIAAIRKRGGITQPDNYLNSISTSQSSMRDLIRNERRIELCFEGFRFWDMRRWDLNLTQTVKGVSIANGVHTIIDVENRAYQPFMRYGPIPNIELLKGSKLVQNQGW